MHETERESRNFANLRVFANPDVRIRVRLILAASVPFIFVRIGLILIVYDC